MATDNSGRVQKEVMLLVTNQSGVKNPLNINQKSNDFDNLFKNFTDNNRYKYRVSTQFLNFPTKMSKMSVSNEG